MLFPFFSETQNTFSQQGSNNLIPRCIHSKSLAFNTRQGLCCNILKGIAVTPKKYTILHNHNYQCVPCKRNLNSVRTIFNMKHAAVNLNNKYKFRSNASVFTTDRLWTNKRKESINRVELDEYENDANYKSPRVNH